MPSPSGQNGKILVSNESSRNWEDHGAVSMQVWTSNGTWSRPSGVKRILVRIRGQVEQDQVLRSREQEDRRNY